MKILNWEIRKSQPKQETRVDLTEYLESLGISTPYKEEAINEKNSLKISAVYRCIDVVSNSIASMPLEPYKRVGNENFVIDFENPLYHLLNVEPNQMYSKFTLWKAVVANVFLQGNAYLLITRDKKNIPIKLTLLPSDNIKVYTLGGEIKYKLKGTTGFINSADMIHILNYSSTGIVGESTISIGARSLGLSIAGQKKSKGYFSSGANISGLVSVDGKITKAKADGIKASWNEAFSPYKSNSTTGGIAILERGMKFDPVSVSPKDSQMLESQMFGIVEICRFFGVNPVKVFDMRDSTYSNVESMQLSYMNDTVAPFAEKIESELNRKLLAYTPKRSFEIIRFNIDSLYRADLATLGTYYNKMVQCGGFTPNDVRVAIKKSPHKLGDEPFIASNLMPLKHHLTKKEED